MLCVAAERTALPSRARNIVHDRRAGHGSERSVDVPVCVEVVTRDLDVERVRVQDVREVAGRGHVERGRDDVWVEGVSALVPVQEESEVLTSHAAI